jgi:riboflavin kinase/FMN adenylyltransferase
MREKLLAFRDVGLERVLLLEFNARLAHMGAEEFVEQILVSGLDVRFLFVGDDFRFGRGRHGDFQMLCDLGVRYGFPVEDLHTVRLSEDRVSSTRVREALTGGDLETVERLLGRPYRICGRVAHGDKRGRTIGFPTANLDLHRRVSPVHGVFAVLVYGLDDGPHPGVANIGTRPTVGGDDRYLLEVHLFDFEGDIYGAHVAVEFRHKLREEQRFSSFEELRRQIAQDAWQARSLLMKAAS